MSFKINKEIKKLKKHLISLSENVEKQVDLAIQSLDELDIGLAKKVIKGDERINVKEIELEEECLKVLALHQPVANDLRIIIAALKINNDLERIADHGVYISEITINIASGTQIKIPNQILDVSAQVKLMLRKALLAFVEYDVEVAKDVISMVSDIKEMLVEIRQTCIDNMKESPESLMLQLDILDISKQLNRIVELTSNIAEDTVFLLKGDIIRHGDF